MNVKEYIESGILEAYALGSLSEAEQGEVAANVARFPELAAELQIIAAGLQQYSATFAKQPPSGLEDKIWEVIKHTAPAGTAGQANTPNNNITIEVGQGFKRPQAAWKYAALIVLLLGSVAVNMLLWSQNNENRSANLALNKEMNQLRDEHKQLADLVDNYHHNTAMMSDTGMQTIVMHTIQAGHPMAATMYWNKQKSEAYVSIDGLPQPPKGMQYQLWAIQGGVPVDMGVLPNTMPNTPTMQKVSKPIASGEAFAISLEKEGGSPTPTMTNIYVMGKPS